MSFRGFLPYESKKVSKFLRLLHAKINTRRHGEVQKSCSIEHTPLTGLVLITAWFGYYLFDPATLTVLKKTHQGLFFLNSLNTTIICLDSRDEDLQDEFGDTTVFYDWKELNESALDESVAIPEDLIKLTIPELRNKLKDHGEIPGPITPATKHLYVKRLARLHTGITYSKVILTSLSIHFFSA